MKKLFFVVLILFICSQVHAQVAGTSAANNLVIAHGGKTGAVIIVSPAAGVEKKTGVWQQYLEGKLHERIYKATPAMRPWEKQAALDLQKYIEMMSGVRPRIADTPEAINVALKTTSPLLIIGEEAFKVDSTLKAALDRVKRPNPVLRSDAIVIRRSGNKVLLAGSNDDAHYYAVSKLLQLWGCRWYLPTAIGECIPEHPSLSVGQLDYAYAPPFEVRRFWVSWNGSILDKLAFQRRNMMNDENVPSYHTISNYVKEIVPEGKKHNQIPYSDIKTATHVAGKVEDKFVKGERFSLGMNDGVYTSQDAAEEELKAGLWDKYFMLPSMTEPFMTFYNNVAKILQDKYPESPSKIGFLAYTNLTIPPQRNVKGERSLVAYLAPIDIDPNHHMDDPNSPPRQEFREMMYRWAQVMDGRVVIYDYDQGNLVWRDVPNPSHFIFQKDVRHYRKAGLLGIDTESRGAYATTFLNLYFRGQLMWNPDSNVDAMLEEFYPKFYGPAAASMKEYWETIYEAWRTTIATEHEYFMIPAIYTPELVTRLRQNLEAAENAVKPLQSKQHISRNEQLYLQRVRFTRLAFGVMDSYTKMVQAAATETDFATAVKNGEQGLAIRSELTALSPIFTTTKLESGVAWWAGEVKQYSELEKLTNGEKGKLVAKLPLQWAFRRDPHDSGLASGWAYKPADLAYWNENKNKFSLETRKDYPATQWEMVDTNLYIQAQGIRFPDNQGYTGFGWYRTTFNLNEQQAKGNLRLMFPGLMNEAWLYINGYLVAHRDFPDMWWNSDYRFEWDIDLTGHVQPGENTITLRINNPHHMGGIFRRPFLYRTMQANLD